MKTLLLAEDDIRKLVQAVGLDALMEAMIERLTQALEAYDPAALTIPARSGFAYDEPARGLLEWMPCFAHQKQVTIKVVGYHPVNATRSGLPTIISTLSAYDTATGHLKCLMDGTFVTALRTGAASGIATRLLAPERACTVGLVGVGAQAVTQLHALTRVLDVAQVLVYDIDRAVQHSFRTRAARFLSDVEVVETELKDLVRMSDIICTATSLPVGQGPLFEGEGLKPWVHINAVGSDFVGKTELSPTLLKQSFVCPDFREQAMLEGECQQLADEDIGPDLHLLVQQAGRYAEQRERKTVFDSTGWALEDHVAMDLMMEYAQTYGLGTPVRLEHLPHDPHDPYQLRCG